MIELQKQIEHRIVTRNIDGLRDIIHRYHNDDLSCKYVRAFDNLVLPIAKDMEFAFENKFTFSSEVHARNTPHICKVLSGYDCTEISLITLNCIYIHAYMQARSPLTSLCSKIYDHIRDSFGLDKLPSSKSITIGLRLLSVIKDCIPGFITWDLTSNSDALQYEVTISNKGKYDTLLNNLRDIVSTYTIKVLPMICKPRDWESPKCGGFLTDEASRKYSIVRKPTVSEEDLSYSNMPDVYKALNSIQSVEWEIDEQAYEVLKWAFLEDISIGKLPSSKEEVKLDYPLPNGQKPTTPDHKEVVKRWYSINNQIEDNNRSNKSKRLIVESVFETVESMKELGISSIWFPHNLDYRGRVYPITPVFNPQGIDYIKSLLRFKEGKPLGSDSAVRWLAIHGANLFGEDKVSLDDRVKWAYDNSEKIRYSVEFWKMSEWWQSADKPFQFLAWCREWVGALDNGLDWLNKIPIALDGSCSGIQHYSAMLKDTVGGSAVNLTPSDIPNDIYQVVADRCIDILRSRSDKLSKKWIDCGINRSLTKRSVMTLPYGLTKYSCSKYIEDYILSNKVYDFESHQQAVQHLTQVLWDAIDTTLVGAQQAMGFLRYLSSELSKHGLPIRWKTPGGFIVNQANYKYKSYQTRIKVDSKIDGVKDYWPRLKKRTDKLSPKKQVNSLCPNFIHSHDAAHLCMAVSRAHDKGINHFSMIHDSFGTHASDVEEFRDIIRKTFRDIYKGRDPLMDLYKEYKDYIDESEVPKEGTLDLELILDSNYAFS